MKFNSKHIRYSLPAPRYVWVTTILLTSLFVIIQLWASSSVYAATAGLYWANFNSNELVFARGDGTGSLTSVITVNTPIGIAVDEVNEKIYWTVRNVDAIYVNNKDGSGSPTVLFDGADGVNIPGDIAVDVTNGFLYWANSNDDKIYRGNSDGSGTPTALFTGPAQGVDNPIGLVFDAVNSRLYWANYTDIDTIPNTIYRGNTNGTGLALLFNEADGVDFAYGLALDEGTNTLFWANNFGNNIMKGNADGTGSPTVLFPTGGLFPLGVALNSSEGQIFWTESDYGSNSNIRVGNMDGSGTPTTLFNDADGVDQATFIEVGFETPTAVTSLQSSTRPPSFDWLLVTVSLLMLAGGTLLLVMRRRD